jgi:hypothetical protein
LKSLGIFCGTHVEYDAWPHFLDSGTQMPQKNVFRRLRVPCFLGGFLLCQGHAFAQLRPAPAPAAPANPAMPGSGSPIAPGTGTVSVSPNAQVLQTWQQNNMGGATPALLQEGDGTTRLDWHGGIAVDAYNNDIQTADGAVNTPLQAGSFYKSVASSDLRQIRPDGSVDYFQVGLTNSNDRAVLSLNPYQVNNLQLGRTTANYHVAVGDIAPNFSSLGSALGARGLYAQRQFGETTIHGFAGQVAENWEVLSNTVPSNSYIKDVQGMKLEQAFGTSWRTYLTAQTYSERLAPQMAQPVSAAPGTSRSVSAGFQYQKDQLMVTGETASSSFEDDGTNNRQGHANIVDTNWRGESTALRAGYHNIDAQYTSLSLAAQPGVQEAYVGGDWIPAPWLTLTTDLRKSKNSTLPTVYADATSTTTDALTLRANINFGVEHPGWGLALQRVEAQSIDAMDQASRHLDVSGMLNYTTAELMAGLGYGVGSVTSETYSTNDSETENWSLNLGKTFSNARPDLAATWSIGVNFMATSQSQRMVVSGGSSNNTNYTLTLNGQVVGWGSMNLMLIDGTTTQPNGAPGLRMRGVQLDTLFAVMRQGTFKFYVHKTQRNIDDPLLFSQENVLGVQFVYNF